MQNPQPTFQVNGAAIRVIRMRAGIEMRELAQAAGISRRYLNHLELGTRRDMRPATYARLRAALHATDHQLLAPSEEPTPQKE